MSNNPNISTGPGVPLGDGTGPSGDAESVVDTPVVGGEDLSGSAHQNILDDLGNMAEPLTGVGGEMGRPLEAAIPVRQVVEVFHPGDIDGQKRITERINNLPNPADRIILTNALYSFRLPAPDIMTPINEYDGDRDALKLAVGASLNNTLTTLGKMQQEIEQGQDPFTSPQYIRLQIAGNTPEDPTSVVYIPVENSFALDGMYKALRANLWMLNTIGKGPGESNLDYREVYDGIPINPELVSIMDQNAYELEMLGGNLAERFVVENEPGGHVLVEQGVPVNRGSREDGTLDDKGEGQGPDYDQPLEWEISDEEVVPKKYLNGAEFLYISAIGDREGPIMAMRNKEDIKWAIDVIKGYLKYAKTVSGDDMQFLCGGRFYEPRLERELRRLRRVYDLGEQVTYLSDSGQETSEMQIPGKENRPFREIYGSEGFSITGKTLEENVRRCVIGDSFVADYDMVRILAKAYKPDDVIAQLVRFIARPNMPVDGVLEVVTNLNDRGKGDLPLLLQSIGDYNIKPPDLVRVANMILSLKSMDTKSGQINADNPPL